jgi:hypothetical protein
MDQEDDPKRGNAGLRLARPGGCGWRPRMAGEVLGGEYGGSLDQAAMTPHARQRHGRPPWPTGPAAAASSASHRRPTVPVVLFFEPPLTHERRHGTMLRNAFARRLHEPWAGRSRTAAVCASAANRLRLHVTLNDRLGWLARLQSGRRVSGLATWQDKGPAWALGLVSGRPAGQAGCGQRARE